MTFPCKNPKVVVTIFVIKLIRKTVLIVFLHLRCGLNDDHRLHISARTSLRYVEAIFMIFLATFLDGSLAEATRITMSAPTDGHFSTFKLFKGGFIADLEKSDFVVCQSVLGLQ